MEKLFKFSFIYFLFFGLNTVFSQSKTIAEQLGYEKDAKLLIIHADDIGMAHSVNAATIKAFENSGINSASIMVPCPWFPEIAAYAKENSQLDFGLHLTLNSEWKNYRWDGVLPASEIGSLLDKKGFFYDSSDELLANAKMEEVEKELKAQIDRAIQFGIKPTHLDSHMGTIFYSPKTFEIYLNLGASYNFPLLIPKNVAEAYPEVLKKYSAKQVIVDNFFTMSTTQPTEEWENFYVDLIERASSGINELIVHLAYDDAEMQAATVGHLDFGSAWRQNDLNMVLGEKFHEAIKKNNLKLVTWREINDVLQKQ